MKNKKTIAHFNHQLRHLSFVDKIPLPPAGPRAIAATEVLICGNCGHYFHTETQWRSKHCPDCNPGTNAHTPDVVEYLTSYQNRRLKAGFEFLRRSGSYDE